MAVSIAAVEQNVFPARVQVTVTGLTLGDDVELYRVVDDARTALRAGSVQDVADTSLVRVDAEMPFGVPVSYLAVVNSTDEYTTSAATHSLVGARFVVSDAISGLSAPVIVVSEDDRTFNGRASLYPVAGRNILVWGGTGQFQSGLELYTATAEAGADLEALLRGTTAGVFQLRQWGDLEDIDGYYGILPPWSRRRIVTRGDEPARLWTLKVAEVDGWNAVLEARGFTLADIAAQYDGAGATLNPNPFFETNATGWAGSGGSVARSTAQFHEGAASLLLTPTGGISISEARTDLLSMSAGANVHAESWVRCAVSRTINIAINWYTAGGVFISTSAAATAVTLNTWTKLTLDAIAPATTGQFRLIPATLSGTPPNTHLTYIDEAKAWVAFRSLDDLSDDYATLLALAQGDFS